MSLVAQKTQKTVAASATIKPRVARRIIRNYLRIAFISQVEPEALSKNALANAEKQLNRVPGYKLVKADKATKTASADKPSKAEKASRRLEANPDVDVTNFHEQNALEAKRLAKKAK